MANKDWKKSARIEYETSNLTLAEIAGKYKKHPDYLRQLSAKENWAKNKEEIFTEISQEISQIKKEILAEKRSELEKLIEDDIEMARRAKIERARLAFFDTRKLYNPDGSLKPITELDDDTAAAVAGMKIQEVKDLAGLVDGVLANIPAQTKEIKTYDKNKALDAIDKRLGLYEKDNQQKKPELMDPEMMKILIQEIAPGIIKKFEIEKNEEEYLAKCKKWGV